MITIKSICDVKYEDYDEVWAIVRSMKHPSPQLDLFFEYRRLAATGQ